MAERPQTNISTPQVTAAANVQPIRRAPRRRFGGLNMHRFAEVGTFEQTNDARGEYTTMINPEAQVQFHKATPAEANILFSTCISQLNQETDNNQMFAYFLSMITAVIPDLFDVAQRALVEHGFSVEVLSTNLEREQNAIDLSAPIATSHIRVFFGQCLFIMYKTVQTASYVNFMTAWTNALKAHAVVPAAETVSICIPLAKAEIIRGMIGSNFEFRRDTMRQIMAISQKTSSMSALATYVCDILKWTEMSAITLIYQTLISTKSPVLYDLEIRYEIVHLYNAFKTINNTDYPQFFKILNPPHVTSVMARSKFPIIIALARAIKGEQQATTWQFVRPTAPSDAIVQRLKRLHDRFMNAETPVVDRVLEEILRTEEPEDFE